jgi:hypothetical protein
METRLPMFRRSKNGSIAEEYKRSSEREIEKQLLNLDLKEGIMCHVQGIINLPKVAVRLFRPQEHSPSMLWVRTTSCGRQIPVFRAQSDSVTVLMLSASALAVMSSISPSLTNPKTSKITSNISKEISTTAATCKISKVKTVESSS